MNVEYVSKDVDIPDSFLTSPPVRPIISNPIDFASSPLPQYAPHTALVLDNVLSPAECKELLSLAESSVPVEDGDSPWRPALISAGPGLEVLATGYRESDRIIWDQQTVVDRIWERCATAQGVRELLDKLPPQRYQGSGRWEFRRFNNRMRFLKYSAGQYFKRKTLPPSAVIPHTSKQVPDSAAAAHTDSPYWYEEDGVEFQTHYTIQLYLNNSAEIDPQAQLVGGATAFLSRDKKSRLDVNPREGSVLIFQHDGLYHEGAEVTKGVKYTMRTDILYEWVPDAGRG